MDKKIIKTFRDLSVWQKSRGLVLLTYELTKNYPKEEQFALTSQTRRAAVSITANIAEGFGRFTSKDRENFYVIALGSLYELDSHIQISYDLGYLSKKEHQNFLKEWQNTARLLNAFITAHRSRSKL